MVGAINGRGCRTSREQHRGMTWRILDAFETKCHNATFWKDFDAVVMIVKDMNYFRSLFVKDHFLVFVEPFKIFQP